MNDRSPVSRLAVILARGGSKRLPGKNLLPLCGKPLIAWTIEAALQSEVFDRVLVSTDCGAIAREARNRGAWVPFLRPDELASDHASSLDALAHAVRWVVDHQPGEPPLSMLALLQPTSPFTTAAHIREAAILFERRGFRSLSSMCPIHERPEWLFRCDDTGQAFPVDPEGVTRSSHELPTRYRENGSLYFLEPNLLLDGHALYDFTRHGAYIMSVADSIDIDEPADFEIAAALMTGRRKGHL